MQQSELFKIISLKKMQITNIHDILTILSRKNQKKNYILVLDLSNLTITAKTSHRLSM